jgi:hypothetical protein
VVAKTIVAQRDFLVFFHWGRLPMLFETDARGTRQTVRQNSTSADFRDDFKPDTAAGPRMFYRLTDINVPADPADPTSVPKRLAGQELTTEHYEDARQLFLEVYQFFTAEYSHENRTLGTSAAGGSTNVPGEVAGLVIHPDFPSQGLRAAHQDHIHANLGPNGPTTARGAPPAPGKSGPRLGVWADDGEFNRARLGGYEL